MGKPTYNLHSARSPTSEPLCRESERVKIQINNQLVPLSLLSSGRSERSTKLIGIWDFWEVIYHHEMLGYYIFCVVEDAIPRIS